MELGRVGFKERDVADLLTLYGVTDVTERDMLLSLAQQANTPGWWHQYGDVLPSRFEVYIGLEEAASLIRTYEHLGWHAAAGGPFEILRFAEQSLSDVVYLEQLTSALYLDKPADIDKYLRTMNRLCIEAARPEDTEKFLTALLHQL